MPKSPQRCAIRSAAAERVLIDPAWLPDSAQSLVEPTIRTLRQHIIFRDGLIMRDCAR